jgi:hypothetical protein
MSTTVLIILAIVLLIILFLVFLLVRGHGLVKKMKRDVLANAIPAQATVLNLSRGGFTRGESFRKLELKLTLRVEHPERPAYEVSTKWLVDELALPQVQPQQVVRVKINRQYPDRVYPDVEWAEFTDWIIKKGGRDAHVG